MPGSPGGNNNDGLATPKSARSRGAISLVNKKVKDSLAALQPEANVQMLLNFKAFACNVRLYNTRDIRHINVFSIVDWRRVRAVVFSVQRDKRFVHQ